MKPVMIGRAPKDCSHIAWLRLRARFGVRARVRARVMARVRVRVRIQRFRVRCTRCVRQLPGGLGLLDAAPALRRHQRLELRPHRRREDLRDRHIALTCAQRAPARVSARLGPGQSLCGLRHGHARAMRQRCGRLAGVWPDGPGCVRLSASRARAAADISLPLYLHPCTHVSISTYLRPYVSAAARTRLIDEALHALHQPG
jgi:hypothetical protein